MGRMTAGRGRTRLSQAIAAALGLSAMTTVLSQTVSFNVPEQDAASAIPEFARQAQLQILAPADKLTGIKTHTISGALDVRAALKQMLEGTGLVIASDDGHTISLRFSTGPEKGHSPVTQQESTRPAEDSLEELVVRGIALKYRPDDQTSATGLALALVDT